ncbi:MAG: hypothetical protein K9M55_08615 [Candidatus Marinimicrobia bacterium]|nr:hypothetical protein [Candidatus Neomarinimicrobiota bacterium]MCF7922750.1 hypothetical protein [Candidatus Neomarinimicrobiota bacterium]
MSRKVGIHILVLLVFSASLIAQQLTVKGDPVALSAPGKSFMAPEWSPDGNQLAVGGGNYNGIYLISFPSAKMSVLSEEIGAGFRMAWSPNGEAIAARVSSYENNKKRSQIVLFFLDGTRQALSEVQQSLQGVPVWSKSGDFVYLNSSERFQPYMLSAERATSLTGELPYLKTFEIYLRNLENGSESKVLNSEERALYLEISPTETEFVYSTASENLWIADLDGTNNRKLGRGSAPSWSPDGTWIACMVPEDDGHVITQSEIQIYHAQNGAVALRTNTPDIHEMHPAWSPDGNWIAYENEVDGRIWAVEIEGR